MTTDGGKSCSSIERTRGTSGTRERPGGRGGALALASSFVWVILTKGSSSLISRGIHTIRRIPAILMAESSSFSAALNPNVGIRPSWSPFGSWRRICDSRGPRLRGMKSFSCCYCSSRQSALSWHVDGRYTGRGCDGVICSKSGSYLRRIASNTATHSTAFGSICALPAKMACGSVVRRENHEKSPAQAVGKNPNGKSRIKSQP